MIQLSLKGWCLVGFVIFTAFVLVVFIQGRAVDLAVSRLTPECEQKYGVDNFVIGKCGLLSVCCFERPKPMLVELTSWNDNRQPLYNNTGNYSENLEVKE